MGGHEVRAVVALAARQHGVVTTAQARRCEVGLPWRAQRVIVEVDGHAYHGTRHASERDRRRDAVLQAAGYRVVRFTWRQITHEPHAVVAGSRRS